jgi:hypothetical protein
LTDKINAFDDNNVWLSHSNKMLTMQIIILQPLIFSMNKFGIDYLKYFLQLLILPAVIFSACNKPQIQFGQAYVDNSYANIILVDTFSANLSTVFKDSIVTSGSATALVGHYNDNSFGSITSKSFFELQPPALTTIDPRSVYDSMRLILIPNKSYYGDTTLPSQLSVFQLTNQMTFPLYQTQFFNNTNFPVNSAPLGTSNVLIYPNNTDSVFIRLADATGSQLFNLYSSGDYSVQNLSSFIGYFKGLQIAPGSTGMHAIYGFHDTVTMRIYYHVNGLFSTPKTLDFSFYNGDNTQFNQVTSDRSGTPLTAFGGVDGEISSTLTNKTSFLQYITGFIAKIRFPTIRDLLLRTDYLKIIRAELIVTPINQSYSGLYPLPPSLYAYTTDQNNDISSPLLASGVSRFQNGNLIIDPLYNSNTAYTYDVTAYLQQQISIGYANQNGLLLIPPSPASISTFNRVVIGDQKNAIGNALQLKVYYVSSTL